MADQIRVDKAVLEQQIGKLQDLCNSTELYDAIQALDGAMVDSSGSSATYVNQVKSTLDEVNSKMKLLFGRTLDFLTNRHEEFVIADQ